MTEKNPNRFEKAFEQPAFISYIVAGDPSPFDTVEIAKALIDGGTDIIELGLPFSDPVGDGPVIQRVDTRSLDSGFKTKHIFEISQEIKNYADVPVIIMTYLNPVLSAGIEHFYQSAQESGVDGILIVDMPVEESEIVTEAAQKYDLAQILLISSNTSDGRIADILEASAKINVKTGSEGKIIKKGFIYLISSPGVTGARELITDRASELISRVRTISERKGISLPLAVGFGISNHRQAEEIIDAGADGVIVGSAIVRKIEEYSGDSALQKREVREFVRNMKSR